MVDAGLRYGYAGCMLSQRDRASQQRGYDIAVGASVLLAGATLPVVYRMGIASDVIQTALGTVGAISLVGNGNKA
jgi:hypothetical protein